MKNKAKPPTPAPFTPWQVPPNLKGKKFNLIYADPAWQYRDKAHAGQRGVLYKYDLMTLDQICAMRPFIDELAAPDCLLAMWHVPPQPAEALRVVEAWGFKFKTMHGFAWRKLTSTSTEKEWMQRAAREISMQPAKLNLADTLAILKKHSPKLHFGMGNFTRANDEDCLIATRGKPKRLNAGVRASITAPVRGHSQKPDEIRDRLVQLMGDVPRIELFARTRAPGWEALGNALA